MNNRSFSDSASIDSQFTNDEELTFLEACMDCDEDALYDLVHDGVTWDQVNEKDKSGRTGLSHACGNGFMPILELLQDVDEVDANLADNDGNTPLIFAAQAGHADIVSLIQHHFRRVRIDQCNKLGFTALMKAAIQGRTKCAKLLLFAGANPNRRDYGRGLCAEEWARFCGRINCADAIAKYIKSKKYFFKKTFFMTREKWNSEPDLKLRMDQALMKEQGNWIQRHLSFKKKKRGPSGRELPEGDDSPTTLGSLQKEPHTSSSPLLASEEDTGGTDTLSACQQAAARRPSCIEGVVTVNFVPKYSKGRRGLGGIGGEGRGGADSKPKPIQALTEEPSDLEPPTILETDYDLEKQKAESKDT